MYNLVKRYFCEIGTFFSVFLVKHTQDLLRETWYIQAGAVVQSSHCWRRRWVQAGLCPCPVSDAEQWRVCLDGTRQTFSAFECLNSFEGGRRGSSKCCVRRVIGTQGQGSRSSVVTGLPEPAVSGTKWLVTQLWAPVRRERWSEHFLNSGVNRQDAMLQKLPYNTYMYVYMCMYINIKH